MIQLCTEKEVRDMKKYVKLFFSLMVCFTLSFSLYSVVSALEEPTVTDNSETVVEEIPEDSTLTDELEETTEITTTEETDPSTEQTTALSEEENNNEEEATTEEEESSDPKTNTGTPVPGVGEVQYDISKSKTATQLDQNFETQVTLSLPAGEEQLVTDVVFVLDKSTSAAVEQSALDMLKNLQKQLVDTNAKIKVGIVIFNKQANTFGWFDLATQYADIETAMRTEITSGTNTHAGLLAANEMLDADASVAASRKYMVFVSDGITYMFDSTANAINSIQATNGENGVMAGNDCWGIRHYLEGGDSYIPADWNAYLGDVQANLSVVQPYIQPYDNMDKTNYIPKGNTTLPTTVDVALYKTYEEYYNMSVTDGYHCYSVLAESGAAAQYPWASSYMSFLSAGDDELTFSEIENDIYYLVDAGSKVTDYIGYTEDYNFDFINEAGALSLKVGDQVFEATASDENTYTFDNGHYVVAYEPGDLANGEMFTFTTNVPISQFKPVQLTYTLKLTNPKTEAGTYGQYDANGSLGYDGLYTNNSATLYPVDTNGQPGAAEEFTKPTVSYTVEEEPKEPTKPEEEKPEKPDKKDPEKNKGADTATQTNMGLMLSLASMAISGAFILVILQKKRA